MSILIDRTKRVCVQGITGREGQARTSLMLDYGTNVVAGVTPGRGGGEGLSRCLSAPGRRRRLPGQPLHGRLSDEPGRAV